MKTFFERIIKWYFCNLIYVHLIIFILYLIIYVALYYVEMLHKETNIYGIIINETNNDVGITTSYNIIAFISYIQFLFLTSLFSYAILIVFPSNKTTLKFRSSLRNGMDTIHKTLFNSFYKKRIILLYILIILSLLLVGISFSNLLSSFELVIKGKSTVKDFLLTSSILNYANLVFSFTLIYELVLPILRLEENLYPHESEEDSQYEELRTRFTSHNLINDVSNLKVYISILKKEEPQSLSKFLILEELTLMIEDTITKFRNSDSVRTKNPFILHELFDNFLILNEPDLVREESSLEIIYQNPDYKNLEIHQIFYEVYQVLNNLISNARKAIAKTAHKEIQIFTLVETAGFVIFQVSDTGVGIDSKSRNRIFDIGYSTTNGDGLGLLFVQTTLKRFGGEISLLPDALSGFSTTFEVKIPIQKTT